MMTLDSLRKMAIDRGFRQDAKNADYFERRRAPISCLTITGHSDGRFDVVYYDQFQGMNYRGEFGPKGGKRNYAARRIVELLSD